MPKAHPNPTLRQGLVVFAKNKKRVSVFYQRTLGLKVIEEASTHDLLRGPGIEIVVHAIPRAIASQITITRPPQPREESPLKPTFVVPDIENVRAHATSTGGWLKPAEHAWTIRGASVLDGRDPEGNIVQFKQLIRARKLTSRKSSDDIE